MLCNTAWIVLGVRTPSVRCPLNCDCQLLSTCTSQHCTKAVQLTWLWRHLGYWETTVSMAHQCFTSFRLSWLCSHLVTEKKIKIDLLCPNLGLLRLPENIHWTHWMAKIISVACHSDSLLVFAFFKLILSLSWCGLFLQIIFHFFIIIQIYFLYLPVNLEDAADHHSRKIKTTECCKDYY